MAKLEVDRDLIRELATLLEETGLAEIEVAAADQRLRVVRQGVQQVVQAMAAPARAGAAVAEAADNPAAHPGALTSPMVGTAYRQAEPGAPPFVKVGDQVVQGQVVMIIEAMKTFNEIRAQRAGRISRILVENGDPVEFGEALLLIE